MKKVIIISLLVNFIVSFSQTDSLALKNKNTIRWNVTPMFVVGHKSIVLGYERIVSTYQTISLNIGYLEKPPLTDMYGNIIFNFDKSDRGGFDFALDYRFYFKNRNKLNAPDGIYWGPFFSYYNIWSEGESKIYDNNIPVNTIRVKTSFDMMSLGIQMGYQFVLADRFTIDMVLLGPSFSNYKLGFEFDADTDISDEGEFYNDFKEFIEQYLPAGNIILNGKEITGTGSLDFNYVGFRYLIQLGYRF